MCLIAETYMETALPGRVEAAQRWLKSANAGCGEWAQAVWYGGNQMGPDTKKEAEFLRRVLKAGDDDYRQQAQAELGKLLFEGQAIEATPADHAAWLGAAARQRLGTVEIVLAGYYRNHPDKDPAVSLDWLRRGARYGNPTALAALGQAAMTREASDLSYLEGMALYAMGMRQNLLSGAALAKAQEQQMRMHSFQIMPQKPQLTLDQLKKKADAGDDDAAYLLAVRLLWEQTPPQIKAIEFYAKQGAKTRDQKAHIADGYAQADDIDRATSLKYAEKWYSEVGGAQSDYALAKLYNGKSDGIVKSDDERKAVELWRKAVAAKEERWSRLARMELGYRVDKGWSSGNRADDARWAHELAMEFLSREYYQVGGEYSWGHELEHNELISTLFSERAAIYNNDNAQDRVAQEIIEGHWPQREDIDAYAWMRLHAIKQDTNNKQVELAEKNPELKQKIEARYSRLLQTRAESGAFYPLNDPLRTATLEELEIRAAEHDPEAMFRLAVRLEERGSAGDLERAIELYRTLWARASQLVRLTWGRTLMHGSSDVKRDDKGAQKWLWDAANFGAHEAYADLAVIAAEGRGVAADKMEAEAWRRLGDPKAAHDASLNAGEERAVEDKVSEWLAKHPNW
jgi:TPR repeat protein